MDDTYIYISTYTIAINDTYLHYTIVIDDTYIYISTYTIAIDDTYLHYTISIDDTYIHYRYRRYIHIDSYSIV